MGPWATRLVSKAILYLLKEARALASKYLTPGAQWNAE